MGQIKTIRFRTVAVELAAAAAAGLEFEFGNQEDLVGAIIDGIETFDVTDCPFTETGQAVVTAADAIKLVLYVNEDSNDKERAIPYGPQRVTINSGEVRQYDGLKITWPKTRIRVVGTLANTEVSWALIGVHYHYAKDLI